MIAACAVGVLGTASGASATSMAANPQTSAPAGEVVTLTNQWTGMVAEDPAFSTNGDTQMDQWAANANQAWVITQDSSGYYVLVNRPSNMCLDDSWASTQVSDPIIQWPCNGQTNQEWSLSTTNGPTEIINRASNLALQPDDDTSGDGLVQGNGTGFVITWSVSPTPYELLTNPITVAGGLITADPTEYTCESGYHFRAYDAVENSARLNGFGYVVARTQEGDIDGRDPDADGNNYSAFSWTEAETFNGSGTFIPVYNLAYYHSTTPYDQTGQVMLYCDPN
jgi:hypothetical protein